MEFPVPVYDCYDVLYWLSCPENVADISDRRIDIGKGFVIAGVSGGGIYASIAAHLARSTHSYSRPGLRLIGCFLSCPILATKQRYDSSGNEIS